MNVIDFAHLRREYSRLGLDLDSLDASPFRQLAVWLDEVQKADVNDIGAMVLATSSPSGAPSQRIVLLKGFDDRGLVFFTNLDSRKAQEIDFENKVSLLFPWHQLDRQVAVSGHTQLVDREESETYFKTRPRTSQIAAWASAQSCPISSREELETAVSAKLSEFAGKDVPLPDFWGGYRVIPTRFEFWQGRENRLHDRFEYQSQGDGWHLRRLSP